MVIKMANIEIELIDEHGSHKFQSDADCICICDDGKGNITLIEDDCDDACDSSFCDDCQTCVVEGLDYCIYEI